MNKKRNNPWPNPKPRPTPPRFLTEPNQDSDFVIESFPLYADSFGTKAFGNRLLKWLINLVEQFGINYVIELITGGSGGLTKTTPATTTTTTTTPLTPVEDSKSTKQCNDIVEQWTLHGYETDLSCRDIVSCHMIVSFLAQELPLDQEQKKKVNGITNSICRIQN